MSDPNQAKTKAKGTQKTEAIIGAASNKLVTATKQLKDAVDTAMKLVETADEQALKIADNEEKLQNLQTEYANKHTQQHIELELAYKADNKRFAEEYLATTGCIAVDKEEYQKLQDNFSALEVSFEEKVSAEVGKAKGMAQREAENAQKLAEATYRAKEAENLAKIQNLESQLAFSVKQATSGNPFFSIHSTNSS